jgi:regulator of RNase E activity RraA
MDVVHDHQLQALTWRRRPHAGHAFEGVRRPSQMVPGTRAVGRATTVREVTGRRGDFASEDFKKVGDVIDACRPGEVLVIDNGGACVSTFGGLATLAAKLKGIAGLVCDGGVRDREEMEELRFPVFARHMTPLTGRSRLAVVATNVPVSCGGVRVRPGDAHRRHGSGVVCIPAEHAARSPSWRRATTATTRQPPPSCARASPSARR